MNMNMDNPESARFWIWVFYLFWVLFFPLSTKLSPHGRWLVFSGGLLCVMLVFAFRLIGRFVDGMHAQSVRCKRTLWALFVLFIAVSISWPLAGLTGMKKLFIGDWAKAMKIIFAQSLLHFVFVGFLLILYYDHERRHPSVEMVRLEPKPRR